MYHPKSGKDDPDFDYDIYSRNIQNQVRREVTSVINNCWPVKKIK